MSRDWSYRVWDKKNKKYRELGVYDAANGKVVVRFPIETLKKGEYQLEQYTGLKDKNGKEIYEGDIMKFGIAGAENRGVVGYEEDFGSYETYTSKGYIIAPLFTSRGKIIGNIHENRELLEVRNEEVNRCTC